MNLRGKFKKEKGYGVMAIRQDYAGQRPSEDGFCDGYVEWLEAKLKLFAIQHVSKQRELLIAFFDAFVNTKTDIIDISTKGIVDCYLTGNL